MSIANQKGIVLSPTCITCDYESATINSLTAIFHSAHTWCNKIIAPCTLYTKNGIFYFCNRSNRLIYMYVR